MNKQRTKKRALTIDLAVTEFPSWKPYLVHGDYQVQELIIDGPIRSFHSSTVFLICFINNLVSLSRNEIPFSWIISKFISN